MEEEISAVIAAVCNDLFGADASVELTRPDEQFGDFATNIALQLAGQLRKNPREIAEQLAKKLRTELAEKVSDVSVAGAGFINLKLSDEALLELAQAEPSQNLNGQVIVAEYSDPNPFKPLHAGHLYTTLVGDSIARLLESSGAKVIRINYGGDVGLHVGKSMWAIIKHLGGEFPDKLAEVEPVNRAGWLGERYVEGNTAYEDEPVSKQEIVEANKRVYQLHANSDHKSPFAQIYWTCREWSYDYFKEFYKILQISPFERFIPESEVTPLGVKTVNEQLKKGVYTKSDGAVVFNGEQYGLHTRVFINSEGLPTYEAKDVGLSLTKWQDYNFDKSIIITANEQAEYMKVVIASIKQFNSEPAERTVHLTHGIVKLQGGVKMSSRKGNTLLAPDILIAARDAGKKLAGDQSDRLPSNETVLAAVKYAFAKNRIGGDIIYDPKESIALEGNSGPYLQYAHARARSILRKSEQPSGVIPAVEPESSEKFVSKSDETSNWIPDRAGDDGSLMFEPDERSLLRKISEYAEAVDKATAELMPHYICTYLYELAQTFNRFYEHNRVIGDEREAVRLQLVGRYADILKNGLRLLGITAPDKM